MYIHFNKRPPFHERFYDYSDKRGLILGEGRLISFEQKTVEFESIVNGQILNVEINTATNNKPKPTGRQGETSCKLADFTLSDGQKGKISWNFMETGKRGFLGIKLTYFYWIIECNGSYYQMFRIGFGKKGYYYQLNKNNQTVAMIERDVFVKNYCDQYDIYIENNEDMQSVLATVAFIDLFYHNHYFEKSVISNATVLEVTKFPQVLEKYDSEFISRIRKQEGMI